MKKYPGTNEKYPDYEKPIKKKSLQKPIRLEVLLSEGHLLYVHSYIKIWQTFKNIIPIIFEKYRHLFQTGEEQQVDIESVTRAVDMITKIFTPFSSQPFPDGRSIYGLDLISWTNIAQYANRHSYRETAKKFNMSVNVIKRTIPAVQTMTEEISTSFPKLMWFISRMSKLKIMSTDKELRSLFDTKCKDIITKLADSQIDIIKRAKSEAKNSQSEENQLQGQQYQYYYIVHQIDPYDREARSIHPDGKIKCGPFKESELSVELLLEYRKKHGFKKNDNNGLNYENALIKIKSFCEDCPEQFRGLNNLYNSFLY
jgi:hypothetical protein